MLHYTIRCWYNLFLMEMFPSTVISTSMIYRLGNSWTTQSAYDLIRLILEFENKLIYNHSASPTGHDRFNACFFNPLVTLLLPPPPITPSLNTRSRLSWSFLYPFVPSFSPPLDTGTLQNNFSTSYNYVPFWPIHDVCFLSCCI